MINVVKDSGSCLVRVERTKWLDIIGWLFLSMSVVSVSLPFDHRGWIRILISPCLVFIYSLLIYGVKTTFSLTIAFFSSMLATFTFLSMKIIADTSDWFGVAVAAVFAVAFLLGYFVAEGVQNKLAFNFRVPGLKP